MFLLLAVLFLRFYFDYLLNFCFLLEFMLLNEGFDDYHSCFCFVFDVQILQTIVSRAQDKTRSMKTLSTKEVICFWSSKF